MGWGSTVSKWSGADIVGEAVGGVAGGFQEAAGLRGDPYGFDRNAFEDPTRQGNKDMLARRIAEAQGRQAPTATAATVGPAARVPGLSYGPAAGGGGFRTMPDRSVSMSSRLAAGGAPAGGTPGGIPAVAAGTVTPGTLDPAQVNTVPQAEFRGGQAGLVQTLADRVAGNAPSVAENQLRRTTDRNIAQITGAAATGTGVNPALARRIAMDNVARTNQDAAGQAAVLRAGEQATAEQTLGNVLSGARGQDVALAEIQARMDQDANLANLDASLKAQVANQAAALQAQGMNQDVALRTALANAGFAQEANLAQAGYEQQAYLANVQSQLETQRQIDSLTQQYVNAGLALDQAQFLARQELERLRGGAYQQTQAANQQTGGAIVGGLMNGIGGAIGAGIMSDKRIKKHIKPGSAAVRAVLERVKPYEFEYKNPSLPGTAPGKVAGVMAQDLRKSKMGREMVRDTPQGLSVDAVKAVSAALAASADLHHRVSHLERKSA